MIQIIKQAKIGSVVPVYKTVKGIECPVDYFGKLSDYGRKQDSLLLESADIVPKYGENSLGTANPCLKIMGKKEEFEVRALNPLGKRFIEFLKDDFDFCDEVEYNNNSIQGKLRPKRAKVNEMERLNLKTHIDILRKIAFKFNPTSKPFIPYCGLFGMISYDFIDQFEDLPQNKKELFNSNDYELFFVDNLFLMEHKKKETHFIANALVMDDNYEEIHDECMKTIESYEKAVHKKAPKAGKFFGNNGALKTDTEKNEYVKIVKKMKGHIYKGDIFQSVPSRTIISKYNKEPLDIYRKLRSLNPSPYMFFINNGEMMLLGASPEMSSRVEGDNEKIVEIRPIAGTKPRGIVNGKIDKDLDSRYETELKIDEKELAEHTMLIDLARNDIAKISKPGTRVVDEPFIVEKYSHVQHLVSNVRGILKPGLDALHVYLATMNMGTLTGAPKIEAMKLIRKYEKTKRGFYGGSVLYLTPSGDMDSTIIIRSMILKNNLAYIRAGAGIVYDSIPENEFIETQKKAGACLQALGDGQ